MPSNFKAYYIARRMSFQPLIATRIKRIAPPIAATAVPKPEISETISVVSIAAFAELAATKATPVRTGTK